MDLAGSPPSHRIASRDDVGPGPGSGLGLFVDFRTKPADYRHWKLSMDGRVAILALDVDEHGGLLPGYALKLNSYDLGVDIELHDAMQRLRFEHPEIGAVVITSARERVFSAGANIGMLGQISHADKVNFCKFTNETRLAMEDAATSSSQRYLCAINGTAAGGGYELALAADYLMLLDDGSSAVSLPEVPLLAVLPGTDGLTRLTDKRKVRRDLADAFCTMEEGVRGSRALEWRLVDEVVARSKFEDAVRARSTALAQRSDRPTDAPGITLTPLVRLVDEPHHLVYSNVELEIHEARGVGEILLHGPSSEPPPRPDGLPAIGAGFWALALARELDDILLHVRHNLPEIGTLVFRSRGDLARVIRHDRFVCEFRSDWLVREIVALWKRTLWRLDLTSRSLIALVEPGSCFGGTLLEVVLAADRSYMLDGPPDETAACVSLTEANFDLYPGLTELSRLEARFLDDPSGVSAVRPTIEQPLGASDASHHRLVTFTPDEIDWEDEVRLGLEERAGFSPDALVAMEANLRFPGPETMASKIFARLSAWQNWIFQRPNAVGERGALTLYGSGTRPQFDRRRT